MVALIADANSAFKRAARNVLHTFVSDGATVWPAVHVLLLVLPGVTRLNSSKKTLGLFAHRRSHHCTPFFKGVMGWEIFPIFLFKSQIKSCERPLFSYGSAVKVRIFFLKRAFGAAAFGGAFGMSLCP